jgi:hypothetical protein
MDLIWYSIFTARLLLKGLNCSASALDIINGVQISGWRIEPLKGNIVKYLAMPIHSKVILECRNLDLPGKARIYLTAKGHHCGET